MAYRSITPELTLEEIQNYFNLGKPLPRKELPSGYQGQCFDPNAGKPEPVCETDILNDNYSLSTAFDGDDNEGTVQDVYGSMISGDMQDLEIETIPPLIDKFSSFHNTDELLEVYKHYNFKHEYNKDLPITRYRNEILTTIASNLVTIIQGSTGSGKTTQVPQFILDEHASAGKYCNIVVTQPRKIAAISIANRVSQERRWHTGELVGYQVGLDKKTSQDTRITYVTTGVLLRHLIKAKHMNEYTHIILDEVHERDQETDFAMLLVRKLLWLNSKSVKVILMSATFDTELFAEYFGSPVSSQLQLAPTISVSGRLYTVTEHYIEDLNCLGDCPIFDSANPEISYEAYTISSRLIVHLDKMERSERAEKESSNSSQNQDIFRGSVLVFLPGIHQIREMEEILNFERVHSQLQIIPLHSSITLEEQGQVFAKPKPGFRKVILSTNIAESSITVPDIKYVLDFCLTKSVVCDTDTNYQSLRLQWASKASASQRAGRAGRVSNGRVYRFVTRYFWEQLSDYAIPELQRCSLENAILQVKLLDLGEPRSILSLALSPPDLHNIERTILLLKEIGALSTDLLSRKRLDGNLTFVGRVLASLPIDMRLGKLVMLGFVFGCFSDCLIIAASLSKPCFLATPYNDLLGAFRKKLIWAEGSFSDCIAMLNAYKAWDRCVQTQQFRRKRDEQLWGRENYVQIRRIHEVRYQMDELRHRLHHFNIRSDDSDYWSSAEPKQNELILKITMAGAFYPNYFEQSILDEHDRVKEMSMLDPTRTVMFKGLPCGKAPLFKDALIHLTKSCGKQKNIFYDGAKAFIEFDDAGDIDTGSVLPAVYIAAKIRDVKRKVELRQSYAEKQRDPGFRMPTFLYEPIQVCEYKREIPKLGEQMWFLVQVTHITSATRFWGSKFQKRNVSLLQQMQVQIQNEISVRVALGSLSVGSLVLAPFNDGESVSYYRAVITQLRPVLSVHFVDYGNAALNLDAKDLRRVPETLENIPFQAIEFRLRGIEVIKSKPVDESKRFLHRLIESSHNDTVRVKVFSVVSGVTCVDVFTMDDQYINEILIKNYHCEAVEESRLSQISHSKWESCNEEEDPIDDQVDDDVSDKYGDEWVKVGDDIRGPPIPMSKGHTITIYGPRTTFDASFSSIINIGRLRNISVDKSSINSVSINQNPSSTVRTMMVASEVGINQTGSTMLARNATLLPNIKGLQALLCVLFAPIVEFRVDRRQMTYTGAICGLGPMQTRHGWFSMLPDHDIEVVFETEFLVQDIVDVNSLRMMINLMVGSSEQIASWSQSVIHKMQKSARAKLLSLIQKSRANVEPETSIKPYVWRLIPEEDVISNQVTDCQANLRDFFRLHDGIMLRDVPGKIRKV